MPIGDESDPDHRRPPTMRRDRLAALLIVLLIAGWLWLLWLIR
jgi:ferric-dicitrate binding protein FerR (iron transport regulator)